MARDDPFADVDRILGAIDYAGQAAALEEKHRAAMAGLLRECLEVVDSLETLEAHCGELQQAGAERVPARSVGLIRRQMLRALANASVEPMNAAGTPLDLDRHDVAEVRPDAAVAESTVLEERVRGYLWKGALLRRARVVVSRLPDDPEPAEPKGEAE